MLAGVGVTWYTWLEQGRPIKASTQVLDAVARTLRMDRAERWHLYRLAEATPVRVGRVGGAVPDAIAEIIHSLDPLPASLLNARFDMLLSNAASELDVPALPEARIVVYTPQDGQTRDRLPLTRLSPQGNAASLS